MAPPLPVSVKEKRGWADGTMEGNCSSSRGTLEAKRIMPSETDVAPKVGRTGLGLVGNLRARLC